MTFDEFDMLVLVEFDVYSTARPALNGGIYKWKGKFRRKPKFGVDKVMRAERIRSPPSYVVHLRLHPPIRSPLTHILASFYARPRPVFGLQ